MKGPDADPNPCRPKPPSPELLRSYADWVERKRVRHCLSLRRAQLYVSGVLCLLLTALIEPTSQSALFAAVVEAFIFTFGERILQEPLDSLLRAIVHPSCCFSMAAVNLLSQLELASESTAYHEIEECMKALSSADYHRFPPSERNRSAEVLSLPHFMVLMTFLWIVVLSRSPWRDDSRAVVPVPLIFSLLIFLYVVNTIAPVFYYNLPVKKPERRLTQRLVHKLLRTLDRTPLRFCSVWIRDCMPPLEEEGEVWEHRQFREFSARSQREDEDIGEKGTAASGKGGDRPLKG